VELKLASEEAIVDALALKFGFDVARLDRLEQYAFGQAKALVPREYAVRNHVFPISADTGVLTVAMSDPTNLALTDELAFRSGRRVKVCIAGENAIAAAVRAHYGADALAGREAIALDVDDGTAVEPLYDPIGATSSEELNRFFQQPASAAPPAAHGTGRPAPPRPRPRSHEDLQLEDQPTGSLPLEGELIPDDAAEELQPIPLEPEAAVQGEASWDPVAAPAPTEDAGAPQREYTSEESLILSALDKMVAGDDAVPTVIRPAQLLAVLVRLMLRKQLITEQELLDEILHG
jgi:type IV pilus assembly protein PilB